VPRMHLQFLIPSATLLSIPAIAFLGTRRNWQNSKKADTFVFAPLLAHFMLACGLLLCLLPLLPHFGNIPVWKYLVFFVPVLLYTVAITAWYLFYRVVVTHKAIAIGAFRVRTVLFADVVDWGVIRGGGTRDLVMYLRSGPMLRVPGHLLNDFNQFVDLVASRMAPLPAAQPGQSEKFQNRARRAQNSRALGLILFVGFGLIALLLIIIKKLP
jgi:hypothetical protein